MNPNLRFLDYPISAGMMHGAQRWEEISDKLEGTPQSIRDMISSPHSASFVRGLVKRYKLAPEQGRVIAYAILQVALGELTAVSLPSVLSMELKLANEQAQNMAKEIEEDLLMSLMPEVGKIRPSNKSSEKKAPDSAGLDNVLDLKDQPPAELPPPPPPMPSGG